METEWWKRSVLASSLRTLFLHLINDYYNHGKRGHFQFN